MSSDFAEQFQQRHHQTYGFAFPGYPVEVTTLRLHCQGEDRFTMTRLFPSSPPSPRIKVPEATEVWLDTGKTTTPVWYRQTLATNIRFHGPALIIEDMATILVLPEFNGWVDDLGHIHLQAQKH
jgi:N-methylhydantoinase A/oxoprolinase/acetone carboxylase beta subunit